MKILQKIIFFTVALLFIQNVFSQDSLQIHENIFSINNFELFQMCNEHMCNNNRNYRPHPVIRIIGGIFITAGIGAIIASPFIFTFGNNDPDHFSFNNPAVVTSVSLFGGGLLSLITGSFLLGNK
jgi:hypothetical protein